MPMQQGKIVMLSGDTVRAVLRSSSPEAVKESAARGLILQLADSAAPDAVANAALLAMRDLGDKNLAIDLLHKATDAYLARLAVLGGSHAYATEEYEDEYDSISLKVAACRNFKSVVLSSKSPTDEANAIRAFESRIRMRE